MTFRGRLSSSADMARGGFRSKAERQRNTPECPPSGADQLVPGRVVVMLERIPLVAGAWPDRNAVVDHGARIELLVDPVRASRRHAAALRDPVNGHPVLGVEPAGEL